MKRILALLLAVLKLGLTACQTVPQGGETTEVQNTQSPEEEKVLKVLNISNSHGQDAMWLLPRVLKAEVPEQEIYIAELYQAYALTEHIEAAKNDDAVYFYYTTDNGDSWKTTENVSIKMALADQRWDIIMFNESSRHLGLEEKMSQGMVDWFRSYILENLDYEPTLLYNMTWASPTDDRFYTDKDRLNPTATFRSTYLKDYGFNHVKHYNKLVELTKKYLVGHEGFEQIIYNAKPVQYASEVLGVPQYDIEQKMDLYRDYTHLSDFARLMVAYQWYAQVFDVELTDVKVNVVPKNLRAHPSQQRMGDLVITDEHKAIIVESVNATLKDPFEIPAK